MPYLQLFGIAIGLLTLCLNKKIVLSFAKSNQLDDINRAATQTICKESPLELF